MKKIFERSVVCCAAWTMLPLWWKMKFDTEATIPFWSGQVSSKMAFGFMMVTLRGFHSAATAFLQKFPIAHNVIPPACLLAPACYIEGAGNQISLPIQAGI
jgi:hypothetical protein